MTNEIRSRTKAKKLQGQVAIVTGGGRGIGAAAAVRLAQAGAAVVLVARSQDQIESVAQTIKSQGGRAIAVPVDISDPEQIEEVVESAIDQFNRVDILVNNAAVVWPVEEILESDPDEWTYAMHVNLVAPYTLTRNVLPLMLAQKHGRIVNITSGAAHTPITGMGAYCASKAGLEMFSNVLAKEIAESGVTVNCLSPGMVDTDMQADIRSVDTSETNLNYEHWHNTHAQGNLISPETVAEALYWLAGPWSKVHNGGRFDVNDAEWQAQIARDFG